MKTPIPFLLYAGLSERSEKQARAASPHDAPLTAPLPPRGEGPLLWIHAASPVAVRSARSLVPHLHDDYPGLNVLITVCSETCLEQVAVTFGPTDASGRTHIFPVPADTKEDVLAFLDHWNPDTLVWIGGGFRPGLMRRVSERDIPSLAIESPNSATALLRSWKIPGLLAATLRCFDHSVCARNDTLALWRRAGLSPATTELLGYVDASGIAPVLDEDELDHRRAQIGTRPVWFASQLTIGEVQDVIKAHRRALRRAHRLLLAVSLSEPEHRSAVREQLVSAGLLTADLTEMDAIPEPAQVVLLPEDPDLGDSDDLWHRIASVSFLGQSLTAQGGTDPAAAAAMGSAILHGPYVDQHESFYTRLTEAGASRQVRNTQQLSDEVERLLAPDAAALMANAAWEITSSGAEVTDHVVSLILDFLERQDRRLA